ncbi:MAG: type VI secretion system baseplate subunit TssK [Planctomycetes bacterium]|nr:type VI secretion system baseplate subunit TssK [Planctomycetota bacterium]
MRNPPVHWQEGLFLRPHHFQVAERHWMEAAQTSQQWDLPYHYGLHAIEFSREALANHQFQVHRLHARMRDGTLVSLEAGQEPDRLDLKESIEQAASASADLEEAFVKQPVVRVYLAVPKLKLGRANVHAGDGEARFAEATTTVPDESGGGNEQEIQVRRLNAKLLLSTQDLSGYEVLPVAQIKRASEGEARPQIDQEYIPPVLSIDAWPGLGRDIVRAVYDILGKKIEVLSHQVSDRAIGFAAADAGDVNRMLMLAELNAAYAALAVIAFAQGVHPLVAYTELCRVVGQLSIFSEERRPEDIPPYDHEDLARIFRLIRDRIERLINTVRDYEYEQRFFAGAGMGLQVTLEPKWFNSNWQWYIGVNKGDLTQQDCRELLSPGYLDWKLGSSRQVEILFKHRAEGLRLSPLDRPVRALPARPDWMFYEVPRDGAAWRDVQETQTLAIRLRDSLIANLDRLQGERRLVVSARGRTVELQFALFAVPTRL